MRTVKLAISAIVVSSMLATLSFASSRNDSKGAAAPPVGGAAKRSCCPLNGSYAVNYLKPRQPKNADLATADDRKYTAAISTLEKQAAAPARANQQTNLIQPIATQFRLGLMHLRYGQETKALDAFTKGWTGMPDLLKETKNTTAAASSARAHLIELQKLIPRDPALVLTLMITLSPQHEAAFNAIEQPKLKPLLGMPLAGTWTQLMQFGQLDKASLGKGAGWVLMFPNLVASNQTLPPEMRNEYETQLTQVSIKINERIRLLAERQRAQAIGMRSAMQSNAEAQGDDPMLQQSMANLDTKRSPLMQFMSADIAFRFGQFQDGLRASAAGWKELIEFYRVAGGGASTADTDMHFDILNQIVIANPVQGSIVLDQLDPAYRMVTPMMPFVGVKVAGTWTKLAAELPLRAAMLEKAVFWNEYVGKTGKDTKTTPNAGLAELRKRLDQAKKNESTKSDDVAKEAAAKPNRTNKAARDETPDTKSQTRQTGAGRISIPRSIGAAGTEQQQRK